jgi:Outer membrane protein beta-barrel domain
MRMSVVFFFVFICVEPRISQAEVQSPRAKYAVGGDLGILATTYGDESARETGDAYLEYHVTPRASVRGQYGWAETDLEAARELRRQHVLFNVLYSWEFGRVRPFATVGGGAYFLQRREGDQSVGDTLTKPGGNLGAGIEYHLQRAFAIKTETNVHLLRGEERFPELKGQTPSGFTWTVGVKVSF